MTFSILATRPVQPVWCEAPRPFPGVAVEIFEKLNMIPEMRIILKKGLISENRAVSIRISGK